ncbi:MAG TPA: MBG domain-containing protein, partial [Thermomicrobiales bacterium]|nr:MBG domain-containing protein [Thermomicrobiales bacterium]
ARGAPPADAATGGTVVAWGNNGEGETNVPAGLAGVVAVAAGGYHSLALKADGTVVAWGYNSHGQADVPAGLSGVTAIAAGKDFGLALKSDGTVVGWGSNDYGQASPPAGLSGVVAVAAGKDFGLALRSDGTVVGWGGNTYGQTDVPPGLAGVVAVAAGYAHSLALTADGTVVAWGNDNHGQASPPAGVTPAATIAAGGDFSLAVRDLLPQAIAFAQPADQTYGDAPVTLGATGGGSGNPVAFATTTPAVCAAGGANGVTLTLVGAGTCTVTADQAGNARYATAPTVTRSFTVAKAALTVTADAQSRAYGAANPPLTATISGFVNGETLATSGVDGAPGLSTAATAGSGAGTYAIVPALGTLAARNYTFTFADGALTVAPAALTITADNQTRAYGAADPPFTGTLTGVVNGDVIIVTYSAPATATTGVGDYPIYPEALDSGSTLANYAVTIVAGTLTITPAPLTVTAADQTMALHGAVPPLTVGYQGFVNGETAAALTTPPTCATTATDASPVGSYPITCSGAADPNYAIAYRAGTLRVVYQWSGFTAPFPGGGQVPVFKAGRTIPLKFQLTDASGAIVQAATAPTFSVSAATACGAGAVDASGTTAAGDTGNTFRWDSTAQQYIYNDHTDKALAGMCQTLTVTLDDGTTHSVVVAFK